MKRPSIEDIDEAADWLEVCQGEGGEREACSRVATWLRAYGRDAEIKSAAREAGCTVTYYRRMMMEREA